ncbi:MAG TPA: lysophospholipid acyltransferase family protein [Candidatus Omnitrophota bacterium]|nr:lysophospholipid acyltransferase family protein [Candidatus Omnitrophota bacterium]HQJ16087.1 lysophospholipid acyltransferase family protein [Candidatus Omnitrophota bacterium]
MFYYSLYKIGQWLALHLPLKFSYALAVLISDLHYIFADKDRLYTKGNLRAIFPEKPGREIRRIRRAMFRNFAKYLVDFFRFPLIDKAYVSKYITIKNLSYLEEAIAQNKGVILLTAHLGNWELGGLVLGALGYKFWAVALPHKNKQVNDFFNRRRESKGITVIEFGKAARMCLNVLRNKKLLALVGDRDFSNDAGTVIELFGRKTYLPKGPAGFALKTGAVILPGFMVRNRNDTFTLLLEKPVECNRSDTLESLTNRYKTVFEDYIRKYPHQWYMFRRFWIA